MAIVDPCPCCQTYPCRNATATHIRLLGCGKTHVLEVGECSACRIDELQRGINEIEQIVLNDRAPADKLVAVREIVRSLMEK